MQFLYETLHIFITFHNNNSNCVAISSLTKYFKLQEKIEVAQKRDVEGMGIPEIKYGESMCFVQHVATGLWLTYAAVDAKSARLGPLKRKVWWGHMHSKPRGQCIQLM